MEHGTLSGAPELAEQRHGGPVLWLMLAGVALSVVYALASAPQTTAELAGLLLVSCAGVGKLLPLWSLTGESSFGPYQLGLMVWASEVCIGSVVIYGAEKLTRFGVVRRYLSSVQRKAQRTLSAYPGLQRTTLVGVAVFVLLPLPGTGAVVGSIIGVLLGVRQRALIVTVAIGSFLGCMGVAVAVVHCGDAVTQLAAARSAPAVLYPTLAVVLILACATGYWLTRASRRPTDAQQQPTEL